MTTAPIDYGSWQALAKAQAVEQRVDLISASITPTSYAIVTGFFNGWGPYVSRAVGVRLIDQGKSVRITGQITGGTVADGTVVCFIGSPYQPGRPEAFTIGFSGGSGPAVSPYLEVQTSGNVLIAGAASCVGGHFVIGATYPLDTT